MKYIFEDDERDELSKLFCRCYSDDVRLNFIYAHGDGELEKKVIENLNNSDELIFVFMDCIPANESIKRVYTKLSVLSRRNNNRVVVFPIVCAEYYFICFLYKYNWLISGNNDSVKLCVEKGFYKNSDLLLDIESSNSENRKFVKNFEKFCKLLLKNKSVFISCINGKKSECSFYVCNCPCSTALTNCQDLSLNFKSQGYLNEFPCFPSDVVLSDKILSIDEIWDLHRDLVDSFNSWSDSYKKWDIDNEKRYFNLKYIKE